jgi:myosin heavy subunit
LSDSDPKQNFLTINKETSSFTIYHQFGQFQIEYNLNSWLEMYNKEFFTQRNALTVLQLSRKEILSSTFLNSAAMSNAAATLSTASSTNNPSFLLSKESNENLSLNSIINTPNNNNSLPTTTTTTSLKRQASVRKMLTLSKRKSFIINFKLQIDSVFDSIRKTKPNFVFCFVPDNKNLPSFSESEVVVAPFISDEINAPLMRSQIKAYQILAACRIYRQSYPDYLNFEEFQRRYAMFLFSDSTSQLLNTTVDLVKQGCINIIKSFDLDESYFKIGATQVKYQFKDKKTQALIWQF